MLNLCLTIPGDDINGFTDLTVQPVQASKGKSAQLVDKILVNEAEQPPMPLPILPDECGGGPDIGSADSTTVDLSVTWSSSFSSSSKPTLRPIVPLLGLLLLSRRRGIRGEEGQGKRKGKSWEI